MQNLASIQKRTSPVKFAHLAEKSGKGSISNLSNKVDGELLLDVDSDGACADLGVKTVHRKMLLREIDKLRADTFDCTQ